MRSCREQTKDSRFHHYHHRVSGYLGGLVHLLNLPFHIFNLGLLLRRHYRAGLSHGLHSAVGHLHLAPSRFGARNLPEICRTSASCRSSSLVTCRDARQRERQLPFVRERTNRTTYHLVSPSITKVYHLPPNRWGTLPQSFGLFQEQQTERRHKPYQVALDPFEICFPSRDYASVSCTMSDYPPLPRGLHPRCKNISKGLRGHHRLLDGTAPRQQHHSLPACDPN